MPIGSILGDLGHLARFGVVAGSRLPPSVPPSTPLTADSFFRLFRLDFHNFHLSSVEFQTLILDTRNKLLTRGAQVTRSLATSFARSQLVVAHIEGIKAQADVRLLAEMLRGMEFDLESYNMDFSWRWARQAWLERLSRVHSASSLAMLALDLVAALRVNDRDFSEDKKIKLLNGFDGVDSVSGLAAALLAVEATVTDRVSSLHKDRRRDLAEVLRNIKARAVSERRYQVAKQILGVLGVPIQLGVTALRKARDDLQVALQWIANGLHSCVLSMCFFALLSQNECSSGDCAGDPSPQDVASSRTLYSVYP